MKKGKIQEYVLYVSYNRFKLIEDVDGAIGISTKEELIYFKSAIRIKQYFGSLPVDIGTPELLDSKWEGMYFVFQEVFQVPISIDSNEFNLYKLQNPEGAKLFNELVDDQNYLFFTVGY